MRQLDQSPSRSGRFPAGFSLVEMLVALVFTALLMAGLATVFRSSLGAFVTSGEKISSARRNRMSVDMIYDDLNAAGMLLTSLSDYGGSAQAPISLNPANPAFRITPNVPYLNTDVAAPNNVCDQLDLYFDEALPFEGTLGTPQQNTAELVEGGTPYDADMSDTIDLQDARQAEMVFSERGRFPIQVLFRANLASPVLPINLTHSGSQVTVTRDNNLQGPTAGGGSRPHIPIGTRVLFVKPGLYVRYSIQPVDLDPDPANAGLLVPCLVRDEVLYSAVSGNALPFAAPLNRAIVAENVIGFQVMVSPDGGTTWFNSPYDAAQLSGTLPSAAAPGLPHTIFNTWAQISALLNASAAITTRPASFNRVDDSSFWFKNIPIMLRVDITTRTARPRSEYQQTAPTTIINGTGGVPYKIQTQSIVLVPRHFGLSYSSGLL